MGGESAFKRTYSWNFKIHKTDVQYVIFGLALGNDMVWRESLLLPFQSIISSIPHRLLLLGPPQSPIAEGTAPESCMPISAVRAR
jgi:hypothetical protein